MGATDICPGTHYCANPLDYMCDEESGISIVPDNEEEEDEEDDHDDEEDEEEIHSTPKQQQQQQQHRHQLTAGDALLLNQMTWHRGAAHTDPHAPERIVFIVTFVARPQRQQIQQHQSIINKDTGDVRQFAKGTYFHLLWYMWGHTLHDYTDPIRYMSFFPNALFRSLGIYNFQSSQHWGYDMVTAIMMQLANEMLHGDELTKRFTPRLDAIGFPTWLRGPLREDELDMQEAWQVFWDGTIGKTRMFVEVINVLLIVGSIMVVWVVSSSKKQPTQTTLLYSYSLLWIYGIGYGLFTGVTYSLANHTSWGKRVLTGKEMIDPFPPIRLARDDELPYVPHGPSTFPTSHDVLFGTRFDSQWLGTYERYLDWHKGNIHYKNLIRRNADWYHTYRGLPVSSLPQHLVETIQNTIEQMEVNSPRGRFLEQDYRTGTWHIMSHSQVVERIHGDLRVHVSPWKQGLVQTIDRFIADYRYGTLRESILSSKSWVWLQQWKTKIILGNDGGEEVGGGSLQLAFTESPQTNEKRYTPNDKTKTHRFCLHSVVKKIPSWDSSNDTNDVDEYHSNRLLQLVPAHLRYSVPPKVEPPKFTVGTKVYVELMDEEEEYAKYYRGDIIEISGESSSTRQYYTRYTIATETGLEIPNLRAHQLALYEPVTEGDRVYGCFVRGFRDCYPGTVVRVYPDMDIAIAYDDGDFDGRLPRNMYYLENDDGEELIYYAPENQN
jgi:hypothetical protein